jgi:hypothetical protein
MYSIWIFLWGIFLITVVNTFPKKSKYIDEEDEDEDEDLVGHASFSDDDDDDEVDDYDYDEDEDIPDDMRDFYDESTQTEEWKALTDYQKKNLLDKELDDLMKN